MSETTASRVCIRCGKELTDAASMEAGIGPICRKLDNAVLAASIPANVAKARETLAAVHTATLVEETVPTFNNVFTALFSQDAETRTDWRKEVKRIEWLLSFPKNAHSLQYLLTNTVRALGYVGLAALWDGKASTGIATLRCADGRIYLAAPRNADFRYGVKQISGWRFHANPGGDRPEWSVPVMAHVALNTLVMTHYPNCPTRELVIAEAAALTKAALAGAPKTAPVTTGKVRVQEADGWLHVFTPYNAAFIAEVKRTFAYADRKWNSVDRCWMFTVACKPELTDLFTKYWGERPWPVEATAPVVPVPAPKSAGVNALPF